MIYINVLSIYILIICYISKYVNSTVLTLDLLLENSTDTVDVVHSEHYGLASVEFYVKEGNTINKVVQGDLPVWDGQANEYAKNAILYFGKDPLSLLYLNVVHNNKTVYKYFVKVANVWREVVESTIKFLTDIDRSSYTAKQLDNFATEYLDKTPKEIENVSLFYPKSFRFFIKPVYSCDLEIDCPNTIYIMEQNVIGLTFGKIFTPRIDYAIRLVTYKGIQLWYKSNDSKVCSSVWTYYKGEFDPLIIITLIDLNNNSTSHLCFAKSNNETIPIPVKEFQKLLIKMSVAEYDEKDIECYKDGYLKARDFSYVLKPFSAIIISICSVLYLI